MGALRRLATGRDSAPTTVRGWNAMAAERKPARRTARSPARAAASTSVSNTGHTGSGAARVSSVACVSTENGAFCSLLASKEVSTARPLAKCAAGPAAPLAAGGIDDAAAAVVVGASVAVMTTVAAGIVSRAVLAGPSAPNVPSPAPCWIKGRYCDCSRFSSVSGTGDGLGGTVVCAGTSGGVVAWTGAPGVAVPVG